MKSHEVPPKAPKHLSAESRAWWLGVVAEFQLDPHHVLLLTAAAESWDQKESARRAVAKHGIVYTDRFGQVKPRPEVAIERDARASFAKLVRELNLDIDEPQESRPPRGLTRPGLRLEA